MTAAANEDHKGYHALLGEFVRATREPVEVPTIADGARATQLLEQAIGGMAAEVGWLGVKLSVSQGAPISDSSSPISWPVVSAAYGSGGGPALTEPQL
jgi:hypothetical protein